MGNGNRILDVSLLLGTILKEEKWKISYKRRGSRVQGKRLNYLAHLKGESQEYCIKKYFIILVMNGYYKGGGLKRYETR